MAGATKNPLCGYRSGPFLTNPPGGGFGRGWKKAACGSQPAAGLNPLLPSLWHVTQMHTCAFFNDPGVGGTLVSPLLAVIIPLTGGTLSGLQHRNPKVVNYLGRGILFAEGTLVGMQVIFFRPLEYRNNKNRFDLGVLRVEEVMGGKRRWDTRVNQKNP